MPSSRCTTATRRPSSRSRGSSTRWASGSSRRRARRRPSATGGLTAKIVLKVNEGRPNIVDLMINGRRRPHREHAARQGVVLRRGRDPKDGARPRRPVPDDALGRFGCARGDSGARRGAPSRTPRSRKRCASDSRAPRGPRLRRDDRPDGPRLRELSGLDRARDTRDHARPRDRRRRGRTFPPDRRVVRARFSRAARARPRAPVRRPLRRSRSRRSRARDARGHTRGVLGATGTFAFFPGASGSSPAPFSSSPRARRPPRSLAARRSICSSTGESTLFP